MSRPRPSVQRKARHKKVLKQAKGYRGRGSTNYRVALERCLQTRSVTRSGKLER